MGQEWLRKWLDGTKPLPEPMFIDIIGTHLNVIS